MRPIKLSVEGLTCFKDKQEIDFSQLQLFSISGPTGSGKSSLLDAMLLALYGYVPRVNKRELKEMISTSREHAKVMLEFEVGENKYRISRILKRKGSGGVRLDKHDGEDFKIAVADQVKPATLKVEQILGLDDNAFTQAVILPQGQFAKFLKAQPADRRQMLRTLLRMDVYEHMRQAAQAKAAERKTNLESATKILDHEYEGVSEKALTDLRKELKDSKKSRTLAAKQHAEAKKLEQDHQKSYEQTEELTEAESALVKLKGETKRIDDLRLELKRSQQAAELAPILEEVEAAKKQLEENQAAAEEAEAAFKTAEDNHTKCGKGLKEAEKAAKQIPELRKRVSALDGVIAQLPEMNSLADKIEAQQKELKEANTQLSTLRKAQERLAKTMPKLDLAVKDAKKKLEQTNYDAELDQVLQEVRDPANTLAGTRKRFEEARSDESAKQGEVDASQERIAPLEKELLAAQSSEQKAASVLEEARVLRQKEQNQDAANYLKASLTKGADCPVCEQPVATMPKAAAESGLEDAIAAEQKAEKALEKARSKALQKQESLTREQTALEVLKKEHKKSQKAAKSAAAAVSKEEAAILEALGDWAPSGEVAVETWVGEQVSSTDSARKLHEKAKQALEDSERVFADAARDEQSGKEKLSDLDKGIEKQRGELDENTGRLKELKDQAVKASASEDPKEDKLAVLEAIEEIESGEDTAKQALSEAKSELASAKQAKTLSAKSEKASERNLKSRQKSAADRVEAAGFKNDEEVSAALRSDELEAQLREQIENHQGSLIATEGQIKKLKKALGTKRVTFEQLSEVQQKTQHFEEELNEAIGRQNKLEQQASDLEDRVGRAKKFLNEIEEHRKAFQLYDYLAADLRSDKFQAYILEEAFVQLVQGASGRLLGLTNDRYALDFIEGQIVVVDHDNAGETRISDTLSGGETFLTSLSLALELSDQVQRSSGAVSLDSLFIDEGFGTLDPETLSLVSEAIQGLQVGGRMVGIITHIPALRDEFSQQIRVKKHRECSTVKVIP